MPCAVSARHRHHGSAGGTAACRLTGSGTFILGCSSDTRLLVLCRALSNVADEGLLTEGFFWIPSLAGPTSIAAQKSVRF